jgi:hypothetical protein
MHWRNEWKCNELKIWEENMHWRNEWKCNELKIWEENMHWRNERKCNRGMQLTGGWRKL